MAYIFLVLKILCVDTARQCITLETDGYVFPSSI